MSSVKEKCLSVCVRLLLTIGMAAMFLEYGKIVKAAENEIVSQGDYYILYDTNEDGLGDYLVIESGTTYIGNGAFSNFSALESIEVPASIMRMGYSAFYGCSNLKTVYGYTGSYMEAFAKANNLTFVSRGIAEYEDNGGSDTQSPVLTGLAFEEDSVNRPGIAALMIDFIENDTGLCQADITLSSYDGSRTYTTTAQYESVLTGTVKIDCVIPSGAVTGDWYVSYVVLTDVAGNEYRALFSTNGVTYDSFVTSPYINVKDEFDYAFEISLSNENLVTRISEMADGKAARLFIDEASKGILPKAALDAIAGTDKIIVAYTDQMQWLFYGQEIIGETKDLDLTTSIQMDEVTNDGTEKEVVRIDFADNGELPGTGHIRYQSEYLYSQYEIKGVMNLYYVGSQGGLTKQENPEFSFVFDGTDKWCYFNVKHNSSYLLTADSLKEGEEQESEDTTEPTSTLNGFEKAEDGTIYWYEDGVKQGTEGRGKEIYDTSSKAWYWLDAPTGAVAKSKDVYQESLAGQWGDFIGTDGERYGKWVRYDADGKMVKGWQTTEAGVYYFDEIYGTMAKGFATIDSREYYFDLTTGVLQYEIGDVPEMGWKEIDGQLFWYENYVRQGYSVDTSYRGKEIYDLASDAWYWLDNVDGGKKAVSKDVYQESLADDAGNIGKWVRYDADGEMIKGWSTNENGVYYFDLTYGTMYKGWHNIDGVDYCFDENTGILIN